LQEREREREREREKERERERARGKKKMMKKDEERLSQMKYEKRLKELLDMFKKMLKELLT